MENKEYLGEAKEMTLKELIATLGIYYKAVKKSWYLVLISIALVLGLSIGYYWYYKTPSYPAKLTFMVNENEGGGGGLSAMLGGLGGLVGGAPSNLERILALSKTMRIVNTALLSKVTVEGETDFLANFFIKKYKLHEKWAKKVPELNGFYFKNADQSKFSRLENQALKSVYKLLVGSDEEVGLFSTLSSADSGVMTMSVSTFSEELSIALLLEVYRVLSTFYVDKAVEKNKNVYELIEGRRDSIVNALNKKQYSAATIDDRSRGLLLNRSSVPGQIVKRDATVLTGMYQEVQKNLEVAKFSLDNSTPYVQLIDWPFAPLKSDLMTLKSIVFTSILLGAFLSIGFIVLRIFIKNNL